MTTITRIAASDLHVHYSGQHQPQPCYVELDCDTGELSVGTSTIIGSGMPMRVYHRRDLHWKIRCLKPHAADALLESLEELAQRVVDGYECVFDGHNHVGRFSEDAGEAIEEINALCEQSGEHEADVVSVWDAADWYGALGSVESQARHIGITHASTDAELAELATREEGVADADGVTVNGIAKHLNFLREELLSALPECVYADCPNRATEKDEDDDDVCASCKAKRAPAHAHGSK